MKLLLLAVLLLPGAARAAISYSKFSHPKGDFVLEYPADWKRTFGLEAVIVRPPGKPGESARVSLEGYPIDKKSPPTADAFAQSLLDGAKGLKKVEADAATTVSGKKARRIQLIETAELKGAYNTKLPGPLREVYLIVPDGEKYFVLKLAGVGQPYLKALPEFERIASSLKLRK